MFLKFIINREIFTKYAWKDEKSSELENFYDPLFKLLSENSELHVGTTNYDLAVETFCSLPGKNYSLIDGFVLNGDNYIWDNENFKNPGNVGTDTKIFLYKIHG